MFPIIAGVGSAILFGLFSLATYGADAFSAYPWVVMVFWALVGSGLLVYVVNRGPSCRICRLKARLRPLARVCETETLRPC